MTFHLLTLFPEMFSGTLHSSMLGRAEEKGILKFNIVDIRDFSGNKHNRVDDSPYGGGRGMVMQAPPVYDAYKWAIKDSTKKPHTIHMSPKGKPFTQKRAIELSQMDEILILCGHYEGIDQRVLDEIVDEEISIGDFVLTGGEIPAMAIADSVCRLVPGVLADEDCFTDESHWSGLLEYPHYSRPPVWNGSEVPEVLRSGHHANIDKWRDESARELTERNRPDLLEK